MDLRGVAPARNEQGEVPPFLQRTTPMLESYQGSLELVVVDDGSSDRTWEVVLAASEREPRIHGVRLARNFGHQLALTAGLAASDGDAVITLDSDLQHPPELVPELIDKARAGYDVVYAVRSP